MHAVHQRISSTLHSATATYLIGSQARGDADQASDLDLVVLTSGDLPAAHGLATAAYRASCPGGPPLDLTVLDHTELGSPATTDPARIQRREVLFPLIDHGRRIGGPDLAGLLGGRLRTLGAAGTQAMPWVFMRRVRGLPEHLQPADVSEPPQPYDEFLGYPQDDQIKVIVSLATWIGAGIVAARTGWDRVAAKEQVVARLAAVDPELTGWLREVIAMCRVCWGYSIPQDAADRAVLHRDLPPPAPARMRLRRRPPGPGPDDAGSRVVPSGRAGDRCRRVVRHPAAGRAPVPPVGCHRGRSDGTAGPGGSRRRHPRCRSAATRPARPGRHCDPLGRTALVGLRTAAGCGPSMSTWLARRCCSTSSPGHLGQLC